MKQQILKVGKTTIAAVILSQFVPVVVAEVILPVEDRTNGRDTVKALGHAEESADQSTLSVHFERNPLVLATCVGEGLAITKASELEGRKDLYLQDHRRRRAEFEIVGIDDDNDLALLSFAGLPVTAVKWSEAGDEALPIGSVVAASTPRIGRLRLGLRSANSRPIKSRGATLGITAQQKMETLSAEEAERLKMKERPAGIEIVQPLPGGPADKAGLKKGDVLLMINDSATLSMEALTKTLSQTAPGDDLVLKITRGKKELELEMTAASPSDTLDQMNRNQQMSGRTSRRKSGFSMIMQTDLPLPPSAMGGPVFSLDGSAIGVAIAHADRVTTYAIPADVVQSSIAKIQESAKDGE